MNPNIWGSSTWRFLHTTTFTYPNDPTIIDKQRYKTLFESLAYTLPCTICQANYQKELLHFDLDKALESREKLSYWAFDLHNSINKRLGKKILSYQEVSVLYSDLIKDHKNLPDKMSSTESLVTVPTVMKISSILLLGFLAYQYYKKKYLLSNPT